MEGRHRDLVCSPLYVEIGLHYYTRGDDFDRRDAPACREAINDFLQCGMLRKGVERQFDATDAMGIWIDEICRTPFPVQKWIVPGRPYPAE